MEMNRRSFMGAGAALFAAAGCRSIVGGDKPTDGETLKIPEISL